MLTYLKKVSKTELTESCPDSSRQQHHSGVQYLHIVIAEIGIWDEVRIETIRIKATGIETIRIGGQLRVSHHIGLAGQVGICEMGIGEIRIRKARIAKVGIGEIWINQIRIEEVRIEQIGIYEFRIIVDRCVAFKIHVVGVVVVEIHCENVFVVAAAER